MSVNVTCRCLHKAAADCNNYSVSLLNGNSTFFTYSKCVNRSCGVLLNMSRKTMIYFYEAFCDTRGSGM